MSDPTPLNQIPFICTSLTILFIIITSPIFISLLYHKLTTIMTIFNHLNITENAKLFAISIPSNCCSAGCEQMLSALHDTLRPWWKRLFLGQPWLSFEIGANHDGITFYLWIPHDIGEQLVFSHLSSCYPGTELREVEDHIVLDPYLQKEVCILTLINSDYYPLKTDLEIDPLASITASLTKLVPQEQVVIQLLAQPISNDWQYSAFRHAESIRRGPISLNASQPKKEHKPTLKDQQNMKYIQAKAAKIGFRVCIRVCCQAPQAAQAKSRIHAVLSGFKQYQGRNGFYRNRIWFPPWFLWQLKRRYFPARRRMILNTEELAALVHLPSKEIQTPGLNFSHSRKVPPPAAARPSGKIICLANLPGYERPIGINREDSRQHIHIVGPTGAGKSTLLLNLALQDIEHGDGTAVIDPKGDLIEDLLSRIPDKRKDDVVLIDPNDKGFPVGINMLECANEDERELVCDNLIAIFKKIYSRFWGPRSDDILKACILTLLHEKEATLAEVPLLLSDPIFRSKYIQKIDEPVALEPFWRWYEGLSERQRSDAIGPVLNKLRDFLLRPRVRNIIGQSRSTIEFKNIINGKKILLVNLSKGKLGEEASQLLGSFIVAKLWQATLSRATLYPEQRSDFFVFIDEFQNYLANVAQSVEDTLAEARSYRLCLILAHQTLSQLPESVRKALSANARTKIVFQASNEDARYFAKDFGPTLNAEDLQNLDRYEVAMRLLIDNWVSPPFTGWTLPPPEDGTQECAQEVTSLSRQKYGQPRTKVESEIRKRLQLAGRLEIIQDAQKQGKKKIG